MSNYVIFPYTKEDWETLERNAEILIGSKFSKSRSNIPHLRALVNSSIFKLAQNNRDRISIIIDNDISAPVRKFKNGFYINDDNIELLKKISRSRGLALTEYLERQIINPIFYAHPPIISGS